MRIGFVIDQLIPSWRRFRRGQCRWKHLLHGWSDDQPMSLMRFGWIAAAVREKTGERVLYEAYRPWRRYDAVVFLKCMGEDAEALARKAKQRGAKIIYEANVDYLTPFAGREFYRGMAPTEQQRDEALRMTELADGVIASSSHLAKVWSERHSKVTWVPDNVDFQIVPALKDRQPTPRPLRLAWSGMAAKMFDLLVLEDLLLLWRDRVHLTVITSSLDAHQGWSSDLQDRVKRLLESVPNEIIPFTNIPELLNHYNECDICISPRFLDNSYNLGHTEWKITLPMSVGCPAIASEQPSYRDVLGRTGQAGEVTLCQTIEDWNNALERFCDPNLGWASVRSAGRKVVEKHYASTVVADSHLKFVGNVAGN